MESRAWRDETHPGDPDLFRIEGEDIRYDATTGEAVVRGPGSLLMNRVPDSTAAKPSESSDDTSSPALSFGSDGTTRFSWTQGMAMQRTVADRYIISMSGDVEVLHAGLENDDTLTLSSARVSALIDRPLENVTESDMISDGGLDLGGQAQILRLTSSGKVYARTTDHDVQCERFEYDVANGIAELQARDGRMVTVVSRGSPNPIRATSMRWDMRSGRIQISGARGGMGR
jgi:lipopolysaccharide export system protein LptA